MANTIAAPIKILEHARSMQYSVDELKKLIRLEVKDTSITLAQVEAMIALVPGTSQETREVMQGVVNSIKEERATRLISALEYEG